MTKTSDISLEIRGDREEVAVIRLTRPAKRNALNDGLILALHYEARFLKTPGSIERAKRGFNNIHALDLNEVNLGRVQQAVEAGKLDAKARELDATDPEKARVIREEMLFYSRQKVTDLLTQLAVNIQGYLALDMIRKNNLELMKGVDRATTTTVAALRTAVIVAQALSNQKLVLDQISALNATTGNLIASTSEML
eukprot:gene46201-61783_t